MTAIAMSATAIWPDQSMVSPITLCLLLIGLSNQASCHEAPILMCFLLGK